MHKINENCIKTIQKLNEQGVNAISTLSQYDIHTESIRLNATLFQKNWIKTKNLRRKMHEYKIVQNT